MVERGQGGCERDRADKPAFGGDGAGEMILEKQVVECVDKGAMREQRGEYG